MIIFTKFFILIFTTLNLLFSDFFEINDDFSIHSIFIWYFIFIFLLNINLNKDNSFQKFDYDILYKFYIILLKTPNFLGNYILNVFKKIYVYLVHFRFRYLKNTIKIFYKRYLNRFFLTWRPLFKKTSYFGYYRSNRSKWIK